MRTKAQETNELNTLSALLKAEQPTIDQALTTFLTVGMSGKADLTADWYKKRLTVLILALGPTMPVGTVMEADLLDWYSSLERRNVRWGGNSSHPEKAGKLSPDTLHSYVRACKFFFKWLFEHGVIQENPASHLKLPKLPKRGKAGISEEDRAIILEASHSNLRDYALLKFIESTGCRRGGAAHLLLTDVHLDETNERLRRRAQVIEKGNEERTVNMSKGALAALQEWLAARPEIKDDEGVRDLHVFLGQICGQPWRPLKERAITEILRRYKAKLGIIGKISPHQWRHRWARDKINKGMEIGQVSQLLGHKDVSITVKYYGQFDEDQLQDAYDRFTSDDE